MAIYKYTVASPEGKKLSGTVEAPDESTARRELNNLGFSILILTETTDLPKVDSHLTKYVFEAIDKNSKLVSGTIPSENEETALKKLTDEYSLTVTAIWAEGASEEQIRIAQKKGRENLQVELKKLEENLEESKNKDLQEQKQEQFVKAKIEFILKEVNIVLMKFDQDFDLEQKGEINKKINKLLRIKNSTNLNYILVTAEDLLKFIQNLERSLQEKGFEDKRISLEMTTQKLLNELKKTNKPKTLSEDILEKIENWEKKSVAPEVQEKPYNAFLAKFLYKVKRFFITPPEIQVIKDQIKVYNRQLFEFTKMYFKEPTPEYKNKVKNSIKAIWNARKKAVHSLAQAKKLIKNRGKEQKTNLEPLAINFIEELNSLTGWLLAFYIIYYFAALYLTTKDFGLNTIPQGFYIYDSKIFKHILVILFLMHCATALKINFFRENLIASIVIPIVFVFSTLLMVLNF